MRRKHYRKSSPSRIVALIRARATDIIPKMDGKQRTDEQILSSTDRIIWSYKEDNNHKVIEVTTVSYVTTIEGENYTIIYYDNCHAGVMHRHVRNSIADASDSPILLQVKKKGNQNNLLSWAIKDIRNHWYEYRKKFCQRSKIKLDF